MQSEIFTEVSAFESKLGLPENFYSNLLKEDDWSFVIKLNALVEAATTRALTARLHTPELEDALSRLQMGSKSGKVVFLEKLDVLAPQQIALLKLLGELRNLLVHNVANVAFLFPAHLATLKDSDRNKLIKNFGIGINEQVNVGGELISKDRFVTENPKIALWLTMAEVIACLHLELKDVPLEPSGSALQNLISVAAGSPSSSARAPKH